VSDFWHDVLALAAALDRRSYYQLLDVTPDASVEAVRAAYAQRVAAYHPDRHARETDPDRKRALVSLQARFNEAYRVLSDPHQRAEYDRVLASGQLRWLGRALVHVEDPASPQARRYFQFGKDAERDGDRAGALMNYQFALQLEPSSEAVRAAIEAIGGDKKAEPVKPRPPTAPPVADQRAAPRHEIAHPVRLHVSTWKKLVTMYARDISAGGMFLKTTHPPPLGTHLQLAIIAPDGRVLELRAEVAHVIAADRADMGALPGIGIRFLELDEAQRTLIEDLLAAAAQAAVLAHGK